MIRVLVVGDRPVSLAGLQSHLAHEDIAVAASAPPGRAVGLVTELRPDVVLIDSTANAETFLLCHELKQLARAQRVVLHVVRRTPTLEVAAWVAGASGLTSAATYAATLADTIRRAAAGRRTLPRPPIASVHAIGRHLAPADLSIFGLRMHDVPLHEISMALRLDPLEVDRRVRALVDLLSCGGAPPPGHDFKLTLSFDGHHGADAHPRSR